MQLSQLFFTTIFPTFNPIWSVCGPYIFILKYDENWFHAWLLSDFTTYLCCAVGSYIFITYLECMWALYFYIEIFISCLTPLWFYNLFMLCCGELHFHNHKERQLLDMNRLFLTIQPPHSYAILIATTSESWIEYTSWPQFANQRVSHKLYRGHALSPRMFCSWSPKPRSVLGLALKNF